MTDYVEHNTMAAYLQGFAVKYKVLFILVLLCVIAAFSSDAFFTQANLLNIVRQISTIGIIGVGFTIILASGGIDLSVGSMLAVIGVVAAMASKIEGMPTVFSVMIALLLGILCGALNAALINNFNIPSFIVTLSTMSIFRGLTYVITDMTPVVDIPKPLIFIGQGYIGPIPFPIIILTIFAILGHILLNRTTLGRHAIAIGANAEAARACGISISLTRYGVYIAMGIFTGAAALIMNGRAASAQVGAGQGMELDAVAAVVIGGTPLSGGIGNIPGTVIGCLIVGTINNILNLANVNSNWQLIVKGALIISAIILDVQSDKINRTLTKRRRS
jgi:ribose/xylose/arabinose/galactoside ABC-type transport system permease subunit